jgi:hypothetical protein
MDSDHRTREDHGWRRRSPIVTLSFFGSYTLITTWVYYYLGKFIEEAEVGKTNDDLK